jgi:aryl-alcohol dehydrogenase-like predicted oxidoreductase
MPRRVTLGRSSVELTALGVGTWSWGERRFWGYERDFGPRDVVDAFSATVDAGIDWFDTAEVYGHGESEKILGWMVRKHGGALAVATKFAPLPGRGGAAALPRALDASLRRLGLPRVDLYQIHWCDTDVAPIESLMNALADAVDARKTRAVGVSNYSADEMRRAHAALSARGVPLASNQVEYSLLQREPETNGVLDACRELGVTLMAYSPLAQGILGGKYPPGSKPQGPRAERPMFADENLVAAEPVVSMLREIASAHHAHPEQIALAWLLAKPDVVAIPGAKTGAQAERNAGAMSVVLARDEIDALDRATARWRTPR